MGRSIASGGTEWEPRDRIPAGCARRASAEAFGEVGPAATTVEVSRSIDPERLIEVEAVALTGEGEPPRSLLLAVRSENVGSQPPGVASPHPNVA